MITDTDTEVDAVGWWRRASVYQIYIRSFADGNGDGVGDLIGARRRLDHLVELGVDAIWITPWYPSPGCDGGYDVADYCDIDPMFGDLDEAEAFLADAHARRLRVIIDLVPNHTSSEHEWFRAALRAPAGSPERDRYIFRDGRGPNGDEPPNDWSSAFGGPAWERVGDGQWYLHLFDRGQPDLNWRNAGVRMDFAEILRFWLDRGVDGFRVDVAHGLAKDPTFPDNGGVAVPADRRQMIDHPYWDRDEVHEIIRGWREIVDEHPDRMMVAEAFVAPSRLPLYLAPGEYHQSFNFDLLEAPWDRDEFADTIVSSHRAAASVGATSTWVLSNHDVMRHATRYGLPAGTDWRRWPVDGPHDVLDRELGARRARAAALIVLALPGSVYVYQGEELGLPDVWDLPESVLDDPTFRRSAGRQRGRDGCRVPIPWSPAGPSLGFGAVAGWLPQPPEFGALAASEQYDDPCSVFHLYRTALRLRRAWLVEDEELQLVDVGPDVLAFRRGGGALCVTNMGDADVTLPEGTVVLSSTQFPGRRLPADTSAWLAT